MHEFFFLLLYCLFFTPSKNVYEKKAYSEKLEMILICTIWTRLYVACII